MYRAVFGLNGQEGVEAEMGKRAIPDVEFVAAETALPELRSVAAADSHTRYLVVGQEGRGKRRGLRPY
jgi:hypothetical protein